MRPAQQCRLTPRVSVYARHILCWLLCYVLPVILLCHCAQSTVQPRPTPSPTFTPTSPTSVTDVDYPSEPLLRLETGMHTASIRRIDVDDAERFLVTGSHDKTVRIWELQTGRLLQVLRVPQGEGSFGKVHAVAISPDGATVAAGGQTGRREGEENIFLFDRATGELRHWT